jgi:hypothetical protein
MSRTVPAAPAGPSELRPPASLVVFVRVPQGLNLSGKKNTHNQRDLSEGL